MRHLQKFYILLTIVLLWPMGVGAQSNNGTRYELREVMRLGRGTAESVAWSPDGSMVAVGSTSGVSLFSSELDKLDYVELPVERNNIVWHPFDNWLIVNYWSRTIVFDVRERRLTRLFATYPAIQRAEFSPDGQRIALFDGQQTVIADLVTEHILYSISGSYLPMWNLENNRLHLVDTDTIVILDTDDYHLIQFIEGGVEDWGMGGHYFAVRREEIRTVYDAVTFEVIGSFEGVDHLVWNEAGDRIAIIFSDHADILDLSTRQSVTVVSRPDDVLGFAVWSPDGSLLAVMETFQVTVIDVASGQVVVEIMKPLLSPGFFEGIGYLEFEYIRDVVWRADSRQMAISTQYPSSPSGTVLVWDVQANTLVDLHISLRATVYWSPNGQNLIATGASGNGFTVTVVWDGETVENEFDFWSFSPDGARILTMDIFHSMVELRDAGSMDIMVTAETATSYPKRLSWRPTGDRFVTLHGNTVQVWDAATGERLGRSVDFTDSHANDLAWSPNGQQLAFTSLSPRNGHGHMETELRIWDRTDNTIKQFDNNATIVGNLSWNFDGSKLLSNGYFSVPTFRSRWQVWDIDRQSLVAADDGVAAVFDPTSDRLASLQGDEGVNRSLVVYDVDHESRLFDEHVGDQRAVNARWRPQTTQLSLIMVDPATEQYSLELMDLESGETLLRTPLPEFALVEWHSDGRKLAVMGPHGVEIWTISSDGGAIIEQSLLIEEENIYGVPVAWHPTENWIAVGFDSNLIEIWDVDTRQAFASLNLSSGDVTSTVAEIDWNPNGRLLAVTTIFDERIWIIELVEATAN